MLDTETQLLAVVHRLVDDEQLPAELLGLGDAAAVLAMSDGSLAAIFTPAFGSAESIGAKLRAIVDDHPGTHLKLVILGGDASLREHMPSAGGMLSRRAVQLFHCEVASPGAEPSLWVGGGARADSPLGRVLEAANQGQLPSAERDALAARVRKVDVTPEQRAEIEEHRAFVTHLKGRPAVTWLLLGIIAVIFGLEEIWGGSESIPTLVGMGGNSSGTLAGEPWRLLSSAFLHAGFLHVAVNGFVLLVLGGFLEKLLGGGRYVVLLVVAALGGSLASSLLSSAVVAVGASGAIWGVLGAAAALAWRPGTVIPKAVVAPLRRNAVVNLVLNLCVSFLPQVDIWAHLGGGIAGALLVLSGLLVYELRTPGDTETPPGPSEPRWRAAGAGFGVIALACVAIAWSVDRPWRLGGEPTLVTRDFGHGVTLTVPESLGEPVSIPANTGGEAWQVGDIERAPVSFVVDVSVHGLDAASLADLVKTYEHGGPQTPPEVEVLREWERDPDAAAPTFGVLYAYANGLRSGMWIQVREDVLIRVEHVTWPGTSPGWSRALDRAHDDLLEAPAAADP
ncbi:MAG: rhomboid family intramembrane serine protease [Myxococcota bacterium]